MADLNRLTDLQVKRLERDWIRAMKRARGSVSGQSLTQRYIGRDPMSQQRILNRLGRELRAPTDQLTKMFNIAAREGGREINIAAKFRQVDPFVVLAAKERTAHLVTNVTKEAKAAIRTIIGASAQGRLSPGMVAAMVKDTVGLTKRQALSVAKRVERLVAGGMSETTARALMSQYADRLLKQRARTIARTEIARAATDGQIASWQGAVNQGLLSPNSVKQWIVTPDDVLCPYCAPMDGVEVRLDQSFSTGLGEREGPPLHPNCRCAISVLPSETRRDTATRLPLTPEERVLRIQSGVRKRLADNRVAPRARMTSAPRTTSVPRPPTVSRQFTEDTPGTWTYSELPVPVHVTPTSANLGPSAVLDLHIADLKRIAERNKELMSLLGRNNVRISVTDGTVTSVPQFAHLRGVTPRGWPEGSRWDQVRGLYSTTEKVVAIGNRGMGQSMGSVMGHEMGHAIHYSLPPQWNETLHDVWEHTVSRLPSVNPYFKQGGITQRGVAGYTETVAESFSIYFHHGMGGVRGYFGDAWADEFKRALDEAIQLGRSAVEASGASI